MTGQIHADMSDAEYFAHPALSHSDCKLLLRSPAKYRWLKDNPGDASAPTDDMLFGSAVHSLLLGGPTIHNIDADSWRTNAAKDAKAEALERGEIPLLIDTFGRAHDCADAVRNHPVAAKLLDNADHREVVGIWDDNGVERRAKLDAITGRFGVDVKTTYNAATDDFARSVAKYGYWTQDPFYRDAMRACFGISDPKFLFVVVEKEPPFLVNVIELEPYAVELGAKRNARAIDLYRRCVETGEWPGYGDGINTVTLPRWAEMEEEAAA